MFFEKRHCCCCVPLPEGVVLVGLYGTSFHAGLLTIQLVFGHASMIPTVTKMVTSQPSYAGDGHYTLEHYYQPLPAGAGGPVSQRLGPKAVVYDLIDSQVVDVLFPFLIVAHVLGILVNLMLSMFLTIVNQHEIDNNSAIVSCLVYGVWKHIRWMLSPWLALQGILASILAGLSLYYLTLFPNKSNCTAGTANVQVITTSAYAI